MDFGNTGALRSPFSPRVRQSIGGRRPIGLSSSKKNQGKYMHSPGTPTGDVIYKTPLISVETFGTPLPVMVTEALTFGSSEVSVRVSNCGWWWAVSGRRAVAWPHDPSSGGGAGGGGTPPLARDLTLPQTDLAHKADLVVLFYKNLAQMPSCIAVSPEGIVRYWPSVCQEGVYTDVSCELGGQECASLGERTPAGLLLATTTCTLVMLEPTIVEGRPTVLCHTLRPPSGWLGGIGRRVSLLFFGSMPVQQDTKLVGVVTLWDGVTIALVCSGSEGVVLQLWCGNGGEGGSPQQGAEHVESRELYEHSLRRPLLDAARLQTQGEVSTVEVSAMDVCASGTHGLLVLAAAVSVARPHDNRYMLAHISVEDPRAPRVTSLVPVRWCREHDAPPRLLPLGPSALLYTHNCIATLSSTIANDKVDYIDVGCEGDKILCVALCDGVPVLFSKKHGILVLSTADSIASTPLMCESPMGSPCPSDIYDGSLLLYEIDPSEVSCVTNDACVKLKTALLFHLRRDAAACSALLNELFPLPPPPARTPDRNHERDVDAPLDRTVLQIATEILDDIPAGDPRWKQRFGGGGGGSGPSTNIALGSSAALQISTQLRDKQRAFSLLVDFLRATGLWQRLGLVSRESGGGCVPTTQVVCALGERLAAAVALRRLQQGPHAQLIDAAIYQSICDEEGEWECETETESALSSGALSPSDVCYRRVSRIARVLLRLCDAPLRHVDSDATTTVAAATTAATAAAHTLQIIAAVLQSVYKWRAAWRASGTTAGVADGDQHAMPSLPALGSRDLLPAFAELHKKALTEYGHECRDPQVRALVFEAAASVAELALADAQRLAHTPHARAHYEAMRREAIRPYIEEGQTERAVILAEKFQEFELLIEICVETDDLERLYSYIDKYAEQGMAEVTFAWLADRSGATTALLLREVGARYLARLEAWLAPPHRASLLALHHLRRADRARAALALAQLADGYHGARPTLDAATTLASLAKLCLVVSEELDKPPCASSQRRKVEYRLQLCEQQAALPRDIRVHHGLEAEDACVMPPEELVQMYVECESTSLTEFDYKKALDLTEYIADMERRDELRLRVWCACIRRDEWCTRSADEPADELRHKMFFRLIDLVHVLGGDLEILLPPLEDILTAPELADLVSDSRFRFIIKYGYECVDTTRGHHSIDTCA